MPRHCEGLLLGLLGLACSAEPLPSSRGDGEGPAGAGGQAGSSSSGGGASVAPTPGWWSGKAKGGDVVVHVAGDSVDAALLDVSVNVGLGTCHGTMLSSVAAPIVGGSFIADLKLNGSNIVGELEGSFSAADLLSGSYSWSGTAILCGSSLSLGSGFSSSGTWTATPVDCPFKSDRKCDEPMLCDVATDAVDCAR